MSRKRKMITYESTVGSAVDDAFSMLEELAGEMREAYDNTPESLQGSGVGEARGEAADALESLSSIDVPTKLGETVVKFEYPAKSRMSRSDRRNEATRILQHAIDALGELELEKSSEEDTERVDTVSEIQDMLDEADNVEFPGMYG